MTVNQRRKFLKKLSGSAALLATTAPGAFAASKHFYILKEQKGYAANDMLNVAQIGTGNQGHSHLDTLKMFGDVKLVAAADLYSGRLKRMTELYGKELATTRNYQEILDRDDIDAVFIATPDHWHDTIAKAAMEKGKAVYLEKPMTQNIEEGQQVVQTWKDTKATVQVGSQYVSNIVYQKAKELLAAGEIGELNFAEAYFDRQSAMGAWQYSIPLDTSPETVDWSTFLKDTKKIPFDAKRFFRWRNYSAYGTGIPGDLFVHLFSGMHLITGAIGPERIMSTGGLRYWKDGRDVQDVVLGLYDYPKTEQHPAFNLSLRVNLADGSGGGSKIRLVGSDGEIELQSEGLKLRKKAMSKAPGYSVNTFDEAEQKAYMAAYDKEYGNIKPVMSEPAELEYTIPENYKGMNYDHFANFFHAVRTGDPVIEDPVYGLRAAGPALASLISSRDKKTIFWNPKEMKLEGTT